MFVEAVEGLCMFGAFLVLEKDKPNVKLSPSFHLSLTELHKSFAITIDTSEGGL